ncbi:hypothetical protein PROFUN_01334 [Planoprotostelium fungivorum]|uniref:SET domain-containing protein n=1 Tax=Planoprotostelium fungivorum TaxID=1890364 RepID=A0A2P6NZT7_9EUKA|nr:hypothetical protein PROFUN_01334 [Planoprotostelium fungivorum]
MVEEDSLYKSLQKLRLSTSERDIPNHLMEDGWQTRDFGKNRAALRPSPVPWSMHYTQNMNFDAQRGQMFAARLKKMTFQLLEETLSTLQDYVLSGDIDNSSYYIERTREREEQEVLSSTTVYAQQTKNNNGKEESTETEQKEEEKKEEEKKEEVNVPPRKFSVSNHNSILQFAALNGLPCVDLILREVEKEVGRKGLLEYINRGDVITGFTALHFAIFTENKELFLFLLDVGADVEKKDNYFGTPLDYGRMMGRIPRYNPDSPLPTLKSWDIVKKKVIDMSVEQFEGITGTIFTPFLVCGTEYIEELMFSGMSIENPDAEFRNRYVPAIYNESGDERVVLHKIDDVVGYGVFACQDIAEGEYIMRYGGYLNSTDKVQTKSYLMASGLEGVGLDSFKYRNMGGMINHSTDANAESQCIFDRGAEQAVIIAKKNITKGTQILINYSKNYWSKKEMKAGQMKELKNIPPLPL